MLRRLVPLVILMAGLLVLPFAPALAAPTAADVPVEMKDFEFAPKQITVPVGTTVVWTNTGRAPHNVTFDDLKDANGDPLSSGTQKTGQQYSYTFDQEGTFPYYCVFHGGPGGAGMAGVVIVQAGVPLPAPTTEPVPTAENPAPAPPPGPTAVPAPQECVFMLGFAALHEMIPDVVGDCVANETHNPENGDGLQQTKNGLLVWRKADNWTAFTDGNTTWINGPNGLQSRPNDQRFPREAQ